MKKLIDKLDEIEMVSFLKLLAIALFVVGLITTFMSTKSHFIGLNANAETYFYGILSMFMHFAQVLFQPAILLALAEIIKLMKQKA